MGGQKTTQTRTLGGLGELVGCWHLWHGLRPSAVTARTRRATTRDSQRVWLAENRMFLLETGLPRYILELLRAECRLPEASLAAPLTCLSSDLIFCPWGRGDH